MKVEKLCKLLNYSYSEDIEIIKKGTEIQSVYLVKSNETDTECIVYDDEDDLIISFAGTENNLRDVLANFFICKKTVGKTPNGKNIKVHSGYYKKYKSIERALKLLLNSLLQDKKKNIYIIGHSAGGGLARICSYYLYYFLVDKSISFLEWDISTPPMGNKYFNELLIGEHFHNESDIIRMIPLFLVGYYNPKSLVVMKTGRFYNIQDHLIENYFKN